MCPCFSALKQIRQDALRPFALKRVSLVKWDHHRGLTPRQWPLGASHRRMVLSLEPDSSRVRLAAAPRAGTSSTSRLSTISVCPSIEAVHPRAACGQQVFHGHAQKGAHLIRSSRCQRRILQQQDGWTCGPCIVEVRCLWAPAKQVPGKV